MAQQAATENRMMGHIQWPIYQVGCTPQVTFSFPRSVKNGASTRVDILCAYLRPPSSPGLLAKRVFHELSQQTRGITRLGPYSLDKDSLYLNGEQLLARLTGARPWRPKALHFPVSSQGKT